MMALAMSPLILLSLQSVLTSMESMMTAVKLKTESGDGYATSGIYTVALPDRRVQTVKELTMMMRMRMFVIMMSRSQDITTWQSTMRREELKPLLLLTPMLAP